MAAALTALRPTRPRRRLLVVQDEGEQPARRTVSTGRLIGWTSVSVGVLVLTFLGFLLGASRLQAGRAQAVRYDDLARSLSEATAPVSGAIRPGTSIALLRVPELGIDQVLVQGSAAEQTAVGPGLKSDSSLPGQSGVSVVVGRRTTFGAPFRHLDRLRAGAAITVVTGQGRFRYVVDVVRSSDAAPSKIRAVPARLTLITSDPAFTPDRQLIVSAALAGKALPSSTSRITRPDEAPGRGSRAGGVALLLWAQLLLIVAVAATWAALRFPKHVVWIGAAPVLLAVLWNVFDNLALFLPNTL